MPCLIGWAAADEIACDQVISGHAPTDKFISTVADIALPENDGNDPLETDGHPTRLKKWVGHLRIVYLMAGRGSNGLFGRAYSFKTILNEINKLHVDFVESSDKHPEIKAGDLVVAPVDGIGRIYSDLDPYYIPILAKVYGSMDQTLGALHRHQTAGEWAFVDLLASEVYAAEKAIIVVDGTWPREKADEMLLDLLTAAINPNPGQSRNPAIIYQRVELQPGGPSTVIWSKTFYAFLNVMLDERVKAGLTRVEFIKLAREILSSPREFQMLQAMFGCRLK